MSDRGRTVYRFEDFELDLEAAELRRAGAPVPVEPQVFDLIALLVGSHDRVVTRDEIVERVWGGRIVSESAIASRVAAARRVLGDDGGQQRLIRTLHGRGFRFGAVPERVGAAPPALAAAPLSDKPSIAVLPFSVLSDDAGQEFFADGIAEDIIGALSRFHELSVIARNTSFTYRGQSVGTREIGAALGVKYVLEGSVRQAGNRVRVSVSLTEAAEGRSLWSERFDRDLGDLFAVQDEITAAAVTAIAPHTDHAEMAAAQRKDLTALSDWERVMRARWHLGKFSKADTDTALRLLDEAIARAPDLAVAHSAKALGHGHRMLNYWAEDPLAEIAAAGRAAARAVELDAYDASALAVMALAALFQRDYGGCAERLAEAVRKNPNLANGYGFMATLQGVLGNYEETVAAFERAMALSPMDPARPFWMSGLNIATFLSRRYEECLEIAERMLRLQPGYGPALRQRAASLQMLGREAEARAAVAEILKVMPGLTVARVEKMVPIASAEDEAHWLGALRAAGLPD